MCHEFRNVNILKTVRSSKKCAITTFIETVSKLWELATKMHCHDLCRGWISLWIGTIANVVLHDLHQNFEIHKPYVSISETMSFFAKMFHVTFTEVDISHRILYFIILSVIFKVKYFLMHFYKKLRRQRMSPADFPRLARLPLLSCFCYIRY